MKILKKYDDFLFELLSSLPGETLADTFRRNGLDPAKFGVKDTPKTKISPKIKTVTPLNASRAFNLDLDIDIDKNTIDFIDFWYKQFDNLLKDYNQATVDIFLISLVAYINEGVYSRRRLYTFIHNFDNEERIRRMTWNTYNYKVNYEDWHHVGGAFSEKVSTLFKKTNDKENNGVDGRPCSIYKAPKRLLNYVKDVIDIYNSDGVIMLDKSYNTGEK